MDVIRSILARIAAPAGIIGLIALIGAGLAYLLQAELTPLVRTLLIVGGLGLLIFVWGNPSAVEGAVTSRTTRYGSISLVMTVAFIGILVLINFWVARHSPRWDLSQDQLYSLAPQTRQLLERLNYPVQAYAFAPADDARSQRAEDLLTEYAAVNPQFTYEVVDPDRNPSLAQRFGIRNYGEVVFVGNNITQTVTGIEEQNFTSALLKISSPVSQTAYFLTGHNERSIETFNDNDYSQVGRALERDNYAVKTLSLITQTAVPDDASVLISANAQTPWLPEEVERIQQYLDRGGSLFVLADSGTPSPSAELLLQYGLMIRDGLVIDPAASYPGDPTALVIQGPGYVYPEITNGLPASVIPLATMVTTTGQLPAGIQVQPAVTTSPQSWFETSKDQIEFTPDTDIRGPVPVMAVSHRDLPGGTPASPDGQGVEEQPRTRIAVIGDSTFAANSLIDAAPGNQDLFINTVHWLTESDELISIRPREPVERSLVLTGQQQLWLVLSTMALLPGIVLVAGALVWWGRR